MLQKYLVTGYPKVLNFAEVLSIVMLPECLFKCNFLPVDFNAKMKTTHLKHVI